MVERGKVVAVKAQLQWKTTGPTSGEDGNGHSDGWPAEERERNEKMPRRKTRQLGQGKGGEGGGERSRTGYMKGGGIWAILRGL